MMLRTYPISVIGSLREHRLIRQSPEQYRPKEITTEQRAQLNGLAESLHMLEEKGLEHRFINECIAESLRDGTMQKEEIAKASMLLNGALAELAPGERMPEELEDGNAFLVFLQQAGILSPESLLAIGKKEVVTAPQVQQQANSAPSVFSAASRPGRSVASAEQQPKQRLPEVGKVRVRYDASAKVAIKEQHIGNDQWEMLDSWPPSTPTSRRKEIVNGEFNDVSQKVDAYTQERHRLGITTDAYSTYLAREQYRKSILSARLVGRKDPEPFAEDASPSSVMRLTSAQAADYAKWSAFVPGARYEIAGRNATTAAWTEGEEPRPSVFPVHMMRGGAIETIGEPYDYRYPSVGRVLVAEDARKYHDQLIQDWPRLSQEEQRYRLATLRSYRAEAKKTEQEARVFEKWEKPLHEMIFDVPPRRGMGDKDFKIRIQVPKYTIFGRDLNRLTSVPTIQQQDEMREIVFFPREMRYRTSQEAFWAAKAGLRWEPAQFAGKMQAIKLHFGQWGDFFVNHQPLHIEKDVGYVPPGHVVMQKGTEKQVVTNEEAAAFAAEGGVYTTPGLYLDQPLVDPETVTAEELDVKYQAFKVASIDFQKIFKSPHAKPGRIMLKPTVQGGDTTLWQTIDVWDLPQERVKRGPFGVVVKAGPVRFENGRQTWPEIEVYLLPNSKWKAYMFEAILIEGHGQAQFRAPLQTLLPALPTRPQQPQMPTRPQPMPDRPAAATVPQRPTVPQQPTQPTQPMAPKQPAAPARPEAPAQPQTPSAPQKMAPPQRPVMPTAPSSPAAASRPAKPKTSGTPGAPNALSQATIPTGPSALATPDAPQRSATPARGAEAVPAQLAEQSRAPAATAEAQLAQMAERLAVMGRVLTAKTIDNPALADMRRLFASLTPAQRTELMETARSLYARGTWPALDAATPDRTWTITEPDANGVVTIQTPKADVLFDPHKIDASCVTVQPKR